MHGFLATAPGRDRNTTAETLLDRCVEAGMLDADRSSTAEPGVVIPIHVRPWGGTTTQMFWDSDWEDHRDGRLFALPRPTRNFEAEVDADHRHV
jgi:DUF1680 family protein